MDQEAQIAAELAERIRVAPVAAAQTAVQEPVPYQEPSGLVPVELDELTMFKMHDFFGEEYKSSNADNKTRLQFIYNTISEQIGSQDYLAVLSKANEIERLIGSAHAQNRIYRLYQWLSLDSIRRKTEKAMRLLNEQ